ncbi:MAG: membrane protein [marine bacterium B5-7]|nr:MAG: membrane protein [marine bacterium B5-7]
MGTLRKYIIAGLLVWLPFAATVVIVKLVVDLLDSVIFLLPPEYQPVSVLGFSIPGFGIILAISILLITGMLAANLFGRRLVEFWEAILNRIPLVRSIYNSVKQISTTILDSNGKSFRKVVMLQYPRKGIWSIGFLTNEDVRTDIHGLNEELAAVFVPTTPNPTSGFILMTPRDDITELDMTIEEGFKFIISMGVIIPDGPIRTELTRNKVAQTAPDS